MAALYECHTRVELSFNRLFTGIATIHAEIFGVERSAVYFVFSDSPTYQDRVAGQVKPVRHIIKPSIPLLLAKIM